MPEESLGRDPLLDVVALGYLAADPMPDDMPERILVNLAMHDLDAEFEQLSLIERTSVLVGVRSADDTKLLIEFSAGDVTVMLRVTPSSDDARRVDGWLTPAGPGEAVLRQGERTWTVPVSDTGRFEFADIAAGLCRLDVRRDAGGPTADLRSNLFEI